MFGIYHDAAKPPILLKYRSATGFLVTSVTVAIFTDIFLYAVIVPVIPFALTDRAGVDESRIQYWVTVLLACYGGALLAASPVCGWIADRTKSRRAPFLCGLLVLAGATVMLCVGSTIAILIAGRILQGVSAAVVWTTGLALLVDTVGQEHVGEAMGWVGGAMSIAPLVAPLLGGVVFDRSGYTAVFAMCFALIGLDIFFRLAMIEKKIAIKWLPVEPTNNQDATAEQPPPKELQSGDVEKNITPTTDTISSTSPTPPIAISTPPPSVRLTSSSDPYTRSPHHPRLPPIITLLASPRLLAALWGCMIQAALLTAFDTTLPLHVAATFNWNSLGAGLIFLPFVLPAFVAPLIGAYCDRHGARYVASAGFVLATPFLALLRLVEHNSLEQKALLCALLALIGFGVNLVLMPLLAEVAYVVEAEEKARPGCFGHGGAVGSSYGLFNAAFAAGTIVGPIWAGLLEERRGWGTVTWTLALLCGVSTVPTVLFIGGWIGRGKNRERRVAKVVKGEGGNGGEEGGG